MAGYSIGIAADTREFDSAVKSGIIDPIEDASDKLQDFARDAERASSDIDFDDARKSADKLGDEAKDTGDSIEKAMREGQRETAKYASEIRNTTDDLQRQQRELKDSGKDSFKPASESSETFKDEAKSNLSEVASSFDGSMGSIIDLVQGTFGGVISDLGPLGAIAGTAGAIGVGLIGAKIAETEQDQERLRQLTADLADEYIETGRVGEASVSYLADALRELASNTEDGEDSLTSLRKEAEAAGVSVKDYQLANAGSAKATKSALKEARDEYSKLADKMSEGEGVTNGLSKAEQKRQRELGNTIGTLLELRQAQDDAKQSAKDYAASGAEAAAAAGEAAESYSSAVQDAYAEAGSSIEDYVENGVLNLDKYQAATQKNLDAIVGYQRNMSDAQGVLAKGGHDTAIQYLQKLGPDAAPLIQAFVDAPKAKQDELARIWDGLGSASASSFGNSLQGDLDAQTPQQKVDVKVGRNELDDVYAKAGQAITQTVNILQNITTKKRSTP